ncbi:RNA polymerase sigma-70 factor, ECF subfamily [Dyadobacter sp. SG02]|uniref:RNA polymerase sigma factor n=1 Tax=Dyadobacter sp. SG02 TaxID=1855291 RepID=UPI0008B6580A|nr:sigma-70 family RNA polymerase sigma factor [Dyadobacter sp. SG02]SEJ75710.1 RNA polymerase sigma-70 factor, ECF subfamily [Dyadobacter sp. SG02]
MGVDPHVHNFDGSNEAKAATGPRQLPLHGGDGFSDSEFFIRAAVMENPKLGTELLFKRYYSVLCKHAMRFVGSREIAEDLVCDIFCQFYSEGIFERITTSYRAYLFRAVRNYGYDHLKKEASKLPIGEMVELSASEGLQPDHITQYEELYQDLDKAISGLPIQRRNIYMQFHLEGKSQKEIALALGISTRTVQVQMYRAQQTIRTLLRNKWFVSIVIAIFTH